MLHIKIVDTENGDVLVDDITRDLILAYDADPKTRGFHIARDTTRETVFAVSAQCASVLAETMHDQCFE